MRPITANSAAILFQRCIKGVYNCGPGKPDKSALAFRDVMGMQIERKTTNGAVAPEPEKDAPTGPTDDGSASIQAH
jgi:hypothetical protein